MKIATSDDRITIRSWGYSRFDASAADISRVWIMASRRYYGPRLLRWLLRMIGFDPDRIELHALGIWTDQKGIVVLPRDRGFDVAIKWLEAFGWNIEQALERAMQTPLLRQSVERNSKYFDHY